MREKLHFRVCISGGGPVALFVAARLAGLGIKPIVLLAKGLYGALKPIVVNGVPLNIAPIFPPKGDSEILPLGWNTDVSWTSVQIKFAGETHDSVHQAKFPGSFAKRYENVPRTVTLSRKLAGAQTAYRPLLQLQHKVEKRYVSNGSARELAGYRNGLSAYWLHLQNIRLPLILAEPIREIRPESKEVLTERFLIGYNAFICTTYLPAFLPLTGLGQALTFVAASAKLMLFTGHHSLPANTIIYDLNERSPIFRVFAPTSSHLAVQIGCDAVNIDTSALNHHLAELLPDSHGLVYRKELRLENCYPLDISDLNELDHVERQFAERQIFLFGRYSQWRYVDMHELEWTRIDEIAGCCHRI